MEVTGGTSVVDPKIPTITIFYMARELPGVIYLPPKKQLCMVVPARTVTISHMNSNCLDLYPKSWSSVNNIFNGEVVGGSISRPISKSQGFITDHKRELV
jgi:hypothetical protein